MEDTDAPICLDTRSGDLDDHLASTEIDHDALVDLASEETFQAPDDLSLGSAVRRAACDVILKAATLLRFPPNVPPAWRSCRMR